jgi:pentatricopeptide repeat protein
MFDHAVKTFDQMDELGTPRTALSLNSLLTACNQSRLYDRVPGLFEELSIKYGIRPNRISYGVLVKSYCELGKPELAIERLKEMEEKGIEVTAITYSIILHSLYMKGKTDEAEEIWSEMVKKRAVDVGAYNVKLMQIQGGDPVNVKNLIQEMVIFGMKPDTISYNYLMTCYFRHEMIKEAKKVYEDLEGFGCKPNAATFRTLVFYLCKFELFEQGYSVFKESVAVNKIPDFSTSQHLVRGLVKKSNVRDAKGLIRTVKKKFPPNLLIAWEKLEEELGIVGAKSGKTASNDSQDESSD